MQVADYKNEVNRNTFKATNPSHVVPTMGFVAAQANNVMVQLGPRQEIKAPNLFASILDRSQLAQSIPCKSIDDAVASERRLFGMINRGRYPASRPQVGNQRGDKHGLAYEPCHPTDSPLFKKANSFYA